MNGNSIRIVFITYERTCVFQVKKFNTHWHVAKSSTNWNNSLNTRVFYQNLNNSSTNRNRNISRQSVHALKSTHPVVSHQVGVPINKSGYSSAIPTFELHSVHRATWQNIKKSMKLFW